MARINNELTGLVSFPLSTLVLLHATNLVLVSCMCILLYDSVGLSALVYTLFPLVSTTYMLVLISMNHDVERIYACICVQLRRRHCRTVGRCEATLMMLTESERDTSNSRLHSTIGLREMQLYKFAFRLRIFHLTKLSRSFLLHTFLFALNYVVLIVQTNK